MKKTCLSLLMVLAGSIPAWAQFETASVLGTVRDSTGAVVPGATVRLLSVDTGVEATKVTDESGSYEFFTVRIGTYDVGAELSGFTPAKVTGVKVTIGSRQRVDLKVAVGQMTEAVEVTAATTVLEFRTEVFNLLNKTNFRAANGNRSAAGFGTITQTYDPRQIQFGLKLSY